MPDAQIIPFPDRRKEREEDEIYIQMQGASLDWENCSEHIHHFDSVPGHCHCGSHYWDPNEKITPA